MKGLIMATMAPSQKTVSIHDYPEHLNPFHEDDNHNKIRFWTLGRKLKRSNSITLKDLKNSWAFRSFMKKGKKANADEKPKPHENGESSPIVYRRAMQFSQSSTSPQRSTVGSPERYVYGGSVTPLPRSRFQERLRSSSQYDANSLSMTPRMARSEISGSRLSVESTNPFDEDGPVPPVRARRKKKRAPPPPGAAAGDVSINSDTSSLQINEVDEKNDTRPDEDSEIERVNENLNIELKIVEEIDDEKDKDEAVMSQTALRISEESEQKQDECKEALVIDDKIEIEEPVAISSASRENILDSVSFPKVDIHKYRRNSSVNEDDIKLRRGNLEDFHALSTKRSKSLHNNLDTTYTTYDLNLNTTNIDANGNEEPQKVVCKLYDEPPLRKGSIETVSSTTDNEFLEIVKATREFEREISKLNSALNEEEFPGLNNRVSVSSLKEKFDKNGVSTPNPIPKPRRTHNNGSTSS